MYIYIGRKRDHPYLRSTSPRMNPIKLQSMNASPLIASSHEVSRQKTPHQRPKPIRLTASASHRSESGSSVCNKNDVHMD